MMCLTIAQINPTVGDIEGNTQKIIAAGRAAHERVTVGSEPTAAHIVVFPELAVTGYYPGDLFDEPDFMPRVVQGLEYIRHASRELPNLCWVVGAPVAHGKPGKGLHNALLVYQAGELRLEYYKQLLPTYNIFDEQRHFDAGPDVARVLRIGPIQVGFLICEDGWNDGEEDYLVNPFNRLRDAAPDLVISINASPSSVGRRETRHQVFAAASKRNGLPILYVNQVGGQDSIVYDGASFVVEPDAGVVFEAKRFEEDLATLTFHYDAVNTRYGRFGALGGAGLPTVEPEGLGTNEFYRRQIVLGLRDYARRCGFSSAVVGSSGGIDSALTLALATQALGSDNVVGITMPSRYSSSGSVDDSVALCQNLGIPLLNHPIRELVQGYSVAFQSSFGTALEGLPLENLQARIRGTVLMEYSNHFGHLLLTTGNKSEVSVGYCTLYGDTNGGLGLIGDLYKTEVFSLSAYLNEAAGRELIPVSILTKAPSAELAPGQKDTDSLPPYEILDEVLKVLIEGKRLAGWERRRAYTEFESLSRTAEGVALIARVRRMIARSEYKRRQAPPIIRVRSRAFGIGRQVPIAAKSFVE